MYEGNQAAIHEAMFAQRHLVAGRLHSGDKAAWATHNDQRYEATERLANC